MAQRIGLLGGTFNPIHVGHLMLAEEARERLHLDEVWFVPGAEPPLKAEPELAPAADRYRMVELAIAGHPQFRASDVEIRRGGKSYTVETLRTLHKQHGGQPQFVFIVGSDACGQLTAWRDFPGLLALCQFVVAIRPGFRPTELPPGVATLEIPLLDISSTGIRRRIAQGKSLRFLVPDAVRAYIAEHQLYRATVAARRS